MITEQQQREAYEFIRPKLKGKDWEFFTIPEPAQMADGFLCARIPRKDGDCLVALPPLYTPDGQPDYNTFIREFEPALESANVTVELVHGFWLLLEVGTARGWENPDPYAAFSQWREVFQC